MRLVVNRFSFCWREIGITRTEKVLTKASCILHLTLHQNWLWRSMAPIMLFSCLSEFGECSCGASSCRSTYFSTIDTELSTHSLCATRHPGDWTSPTLLFPIDTTHLCSISLCQNRHHGGQTIGASARTPTHLSLFTPSTAHATDILLYIRLPRRPRFHDARHVADHDRRQHLQLESQGRRFILHRGRSSRNRDRQGLNGCRGAR